MNKNLRIGIGVVGIIVVGLAITAAAGGFKPHIPYIALTNAEDIKTQYQSIKCTKDLFGEISNGNDATDVTDSDDEEEFRDISDSCITVGGNKKTYSNNKGNGSGNLLGTIKDETKGVILTSTIKTTTEGKLTVDGIVYHLKYEENKGKVEKKENGNVKEITDTNKEKLFIKPGSALEGKENNGGFNFTLGNTICTTSDNCSKPTKTETKFFVGTLDKEKVGSYQIHNGSENFSNGNNAKGVFVNHSESSYQDANGYFKLVK